MVVRFLDSHIAPKRRDCPVIRQPRHLAEFCVPRSGTIPPRTSSPLRQIFGEVCCCCRLSLSVDSGENTGCHRGFSSVAAERPFLSRSSRVCWRCDMEPYACLFNQSAVDRCGEANIQRTLAGPNDKEERSRSS